MKGKTVRELVRKKDLSPLSMKHLKIIEDILYILFQLKFLWEVFLSIEL